VPWFRRRSARPRSDPLTIAVLEYELLGIVPEPGTAAAAAVNLAVNLGRVTPHSICGNCRRAFRAGEATCPDCSGRPRANGGPVAALRPVTLEPGEGLYRPADIQALRAHPRTR
jgi:hypothetical protein